MQILEKDFDYEMLEFEHRLAIHDALAETTIKHIDKAGGLFKPLHFDPAQNPSQMLEAVHLGPVPASFDDVVSHDGQDVVWGINTLANVAGPNLYPLVTETFRKQRAFMSAARLLLEDGMNIFPVTTHGNIADIAIEAAGWTHTMQDLDEWQDNNALVISRGVTTIEAFDMAASEVVQKIGHVFLSFPRTRTITELQEKLTVETKRGEKPLDVESLINTNNRRMRSEVKPWLGHRIGRHVVGKTFHMAWSGKTDMVRLGDDGKPEQIELGKISNGTLDIVKRGLVLPMVIWDGDEPVFELGELTKVHTRQDIERVQEWQRATLADSLGIPNDAVSVEA